MNKPTARDLESLMQLFEGSDWKELDLRTDGFELYLSKDPSRRRAVGPIVPAMPVPLVSLASASPRVAKPEPTASATGGSSAVPSSWVAVKAPNLGTFYSSPKPGAAPYVELGRTVTAETEVCLIEVMKLFTSVRAGIVGVVRNIVVQDGEMVEQDQVLLYIERT